jgi:hypothetical protein
MNNSSFFAMLCAATLTVGAGFSGEAQAAAQTRSCLVDSVAVIDDRMHIKCAPNAQQAFSKDILYYAMNLREGTAKVEAIVMLAIAAKNRNKAMTVTFDLDDYKSVPGCQGSNCRAMKGAAME